MTIKGEGLWRKLNHLVVDSVESSEPRWVRCAGAAEAWNVSLLSLSLVRSRVQRTCYLPGLHICLPISLQDVPDRKEDGQGRL
jgi:hypothetical protein